MDLAAFSKGVMRWQIALTVVGTAAWLTARGSVFAVSFLTGAGAALLSFWLLHRVVSKANKPRSATWSMLAAAFRLLLIAGLISATIRTYELQAVPASTGILVVVASILLEAVRQKLNGT